MADSNIDGIFYHNDFQALYGYKKIKAAGISVPDQIKVVGFDDMQASSILPSTLTEGLPLPDSTSLKV